MFMIKVDLIASLLNPLPALLQARAATVGCSAINHLLHLEPLVQAYLKPHAGRKVLLRWESLWFAPTGEQALRINDDLTLAPCVENNPTKVDVTISIQSGIVAAPADERLRFVRLEGDVFLAQDLSKVAKELRWDAEHDLARVVGDAPAYWIVHNAKKAALLLQGAAEELKSKLDGLIASKAQASKAQP
jgi:ubiquinone biosynthesis accessory factor UbiJ